ncbi:hypothetical protein HAP94_02200 [Acidithiobacillus ferrivorans]|nr:hypothetical protein [Acidithiobacillus ferrivorans]
MDFATFRAVYPAQQPRADRIKNQDEVKQLTVNDGVFNFDNCSGASATKSLVPSAAYERGCVYLWVISPTSVPYIEEDARIGQTLESRCVKHTNLTGGNPAHSGGELWFIDNLKVLIGGASGRYGPDTETQLMDAVLSFKNEGYIVASIGFDDDTGFPAKILIGEPQWV